MRCFPLAFATRSACHFYRFIVILLLLLMFLLILLLLLPLRIGPGRVLRINRWEWYRLIGWWPFLVLCSLKSLVLFKLHFLGMHSIDPLIVLLRRARQ